MGKAKFPMHAENIEGYLVSIIRFPALMKYVLFATVMQWNAFLLPPVRLLRLSVHNGTAFAL